MINLPLSKVDNRELFTLSTRVSDVLNTYNTEELGIKLYVDNFLNKFNAYSESFTKQSVDASSISEKDNLRDRYYVALRAHVRNFRYHPDANLRKKAKEIVDLLNKDGSLLHKESYKIESASLESIILEIDKNHLPAIQEMNATVWYDLLKQAQSDFESTLKAYTDQKVESNQIASATEMRHHLIDALRKLLTFLPLHNGIMQSVQLGELIDKLETVAERFD